MKGATSRTSVASATSSPETSPRASRLRGVGLGPPSMNGHTNTSAAASISTVKKVSDITYCSSVIA